ncbi:ferrous iron transport protein B [Halosquirtibacter xylanolyticus]|uniref:ferrous iron transport protein B n=1 Tax=Halosquirtibacter xylanolyticus TaxID=3374599 RepID=UPI003749C5BC|nr:ferrous iron transport protein B [Prolixibacteraceae bacterium]
MLLSEAKTNQQVVIRKINGEDSFRKRIHEMGFIRGQKVLVVKNAPLKDPVEYQILGYNISLRKSEASLIEVDLDGSENAKLLSETTRSEMVDPIVMPAVKDRTKKEIHIAMVGNPNCGKTSLFNNLSGSKEHVGNYSGVTVDSKKATIKWNGYLLHFIDLPGIYSFTTFTPEEVYARDYILEKQPDILLNIIDSTNLERNLLLTTQLMDMGKQLIIAFNMYDELEKSGDKLDVEKFDHITKIESIPTTAIKRKGNKDILDKIVSVYEAGENKSVSQSVKHRSKIEYSIDKIGTLFDRYPCKLNEAINTRFFILKLLERDPEALKKLEMYPTEVKKELELQIKYIEDTYQDVCDSVITQTRYHFIRDLLNECYTPSSDQSAKSRKRSIEIDRVLTHKIWGFPIFILFMFITFYATFTLGAYPADWIDQGMSYLGQVLSSNMNDGMLKDLFVNGIISGVGSVIVFLPNILILFFFTSLMEDTGYMARAAFIMDKIMKKVGLHGQSFIPMLMGFGCNVPAIMATRTIKNRADRLLTMMIIPFMSCSARLPVYIVFITAFFPKHPALILLGLYLTGIFVAGVMAKLLNRVMFEQENSPFILELPPYRTPLLKNTLLHMWDKGSSYLKKIGGPILIGVVLIWMLEYFPRESEQTRVIDQQITQLEAQKAHVDDAKHIDAEINELQLHKDNVRLEDSYLGHIGKNVQPALAPLGFDWKMSVSLLAGITAKEIVVSTMGVLYQTNTEGQEGGVILQEKLKNEVHTYGKHKGEKVLSLSTALAFLVFVLIYFPCIAVVATIKREAGGWQWAAFVMFYTTGLAWIMAYIVKHLFNWLL